MKKLDTQWMNAHAGRPPKSLWMGLLLLNMCLWSGLPAQDLIFSEDFSGVTPGTGLNGDDNNPPNQPVRVGQGTAYPGTTTLLTGDWFEVANVSLGNNGISVNKGLIASDTDGEVWWESDPIDISCYSDVYFTLTAYGNNKGDLNPFPGLADFVTIFYKLDGGAEQLLSFQTHTIDNQPFNRSLNSTSLGLELNQCDGDLYQELVIIVKVKNDHDDDDPLTNPNEDEELHGFDNLQVYGTPATLSVTNIDVFNCPPALNTTPTLTFTASSTCGVEYLPPGSAVWIPAGINPVSLGLQVLSLPYDVQIRDRRFTTCATYTVTVGVDCLGALPITLTGFTGRVRNEGILLDWFTEGEEDNDYMAVERSQDGAVFDEIGRVVGRGTTAERETYQFFDAHPLPGVNYYRLRQADFDGTTAYHPVISVVFDGAREPTLEAFPNPVGGEDLRVRWHAPDGRPARLRLIDGRGIVRREHILPDGNGLERVAVGDLPAGIYFLQIVQGEAVRTVRVVRN